MENTKNKIEFFANVKQVKSRNLISGDKETVIDLRVVGRDVVLANELANLPIESQVKVIYEF